MEEKKESNKGKTKSEKYSKERVELYDKIIKILKVENNTFTMKISQEQINEILELKDDVKKYCDKMFSINKNTTQLPLNIVKYILKSNGKKILRTEKTFIVNGEKIFTGVFKIL